jgi:tetratricopeptide (TPR) repeat protein
VIAVALVLGGLMVAVCARVVAAEPEREEQLRQARAHFRKGEVAYARGQFDEAYRQFEAGYRLSDRPLFLLNMGHAKRRAGEVAEARALFHRFLQLQPASPQRAEVEAILRKLPGASGPEATPAPAPPPSVTPPPALPTLPPPRLERTPIHPPPAVAVRAAPPQPMPPPAPRRWWLWATIGGVVVAAVSVGLVMGSRGDSYTRQGSLGTVGNP